MRLATHSMTEKAANRQGNRDSAVPWNKERATLKSQSSLKSTLSITDPDFEECSSFNLLPSSSKECETRASASRAMANKRIKITPKAVKEERSLVYDDESLQRHVAAEDRKSMKYSQPSPVNCSVGVSPRDMSKFGGSKIRTIHSYIDTRKRRQKKAAVYESSVKKPPTSVETIIATSPGDARSQSARRLSESKSVRKGLDSFSEKSNITDTAMCSAIPEQTLGVDVGQRPANEMEPFFSTEKKGYHFKNPPKSSKSVNEMTSPHQRNLWNKLLSDSSSTGSLSHPNTPGVYMDLDKRKRVDRSSAVRKIKRNRQQPSIPRGGPQGGRPRRIVDTLQYHGHCQSHRDEMLDKDDYSIDSSDDHFSSVRSEISLANGATSVQTSPCTGSQGRTSRLHEQASSKISAPAGFLYGNGLKVTYARQRSHLSASDLDEATILSKRLASEPKATGITDRKRLKLAQNSGLSSIQNLDHEFEDIQESHGGTIRSIHELRKAGGNVRLMCELEAMLDNIVSEQGDGSLTSTRSRLLDLVIKLQEPSNSRFFTDQGLEVRLLTRITFGNDLIASSLFVAATLQLVVDSCSPLLLSHVCDSRVVGFLVGLLGHQEDLQSRAKLCDNKLPITSKLKFADVYNSLLYSTPWRVGRPPSLSCHMLSLQCLEYIVRRSREAGSSCEILSAQAIRRITATSVPAFSRPPTQPSALSIISLELAVSILESCTISNALTCQVFVWTGDTLDRVKGLLPLLASWEKQEFGTLRTLSLRLYINLTNNSPGLCEDFSTADNVGALLDIVVSHFYQLTSGAMEHCRPLLLDNLILALGSLINLAESTDIVRQLMLHLRQGDRMYLDALLQLFLWRRMSAAEVSLSP